MHRIKWAALELLSVVMLALPGSALALTASQVEHWVEQNWGKQLHNQSQLMGFHLLSSHVRCVGPVALSTSASRTPA